MTFSCLKYHAESLQFIAMEAIHFVRTNTTPLRSSKNEFSLHSLLLTPAVQPVTAGALCSRTHSENVRSRFYEYRKALTNINFYFRRRKVPTKMCFLLFHMS